MKPKQIFLLVFFTLLASAILFAQQENEQYYKILPNIKGEKIAVDFRGNIFVINGNTLYKYDKKGTFLYSFQNKSWGNITDVSVASPMKIMLFYREIEQILFLDERLVPLTEPLLLNNQQYQSISLVEYAPSNHIWLYDRFNHDLIKIDLFFNELNKTHLSFNELNPNQLIVLGTKNIILHSPEKGILFFDMFGTLIKNISILTENVIQVDESMIYYLKNDELHCYNYLKLEETVIPITMPDVIQAIYTQEQLILLTKEGKVVISQW